MFAHRAQSMRPSIRQATISGRPRRVARPEIWVVLAATLSAGAAAGATPEDDVRRIVDEERERGGTPAMCVVVVRDGQVLVGLASGLADQEAGRAATLDTQFPAASVSKILTAVLVMRQVDEGRLGDTRTQRDRVGYAPDIRHNRSTRAARLRRRRGAASTAGHDAGRQRLRRTNRDRSCLQWCDSHRERCRTPWA